MIAIAALYGVAVLLIAYDLNARRREERMTRQEVAELRRDLLAENVGRRLGAGEASNTAITRRAPIPIERRLVTLTRDNDEIHTRTTRRLGDAFDEADEMIALDEDAPTLNKGGEVIPLRPGPRSA